MKKINLFIALVAMIANFTLSAQNQVLSLDGNGDYVNLGNSSILTPDNFTFSAWIYNTSYGEDGIFSNHYGGLTWPSHMFNIYGNNTIQIRIGTSNSGSGSIVLTSNTIIPLDEWCFISCTYDGFQLSIYINSIIDNTLPATGTPWNNTLDCHLGNSDISSPTISDFEGNIDEFRIWNYARTQQQIQSDMYTSLAGNETGLVGYWNFENGTANDLTPNGNNGTLIDDAHIIEEQIPGFGNNFSLELYLFLEGSYNGTDMNTNLYPVLIPSSQPYNDTQKWNYQGAESVATVPNSDVVDWVLVELRETSGDASTAIADSMIARKAAFLLKDGTIVNLNGDSPLYFDNEITDNLFVVVYHRNHLPIMSSGSLTEINEGYSWDFTTTEGQAYGTDSQKNLGAIYGMIGGDSDANGIIDIDDKDLDWSTDAGNTGYYPSDLNMDSQINNPDKNDIWEPNLDKESQIPVF